MIVDEALQDAVSKLRHAASDNRHVEAAQMQLINLAEVMNAAGPDAPKVKERIRLGTMSFLRGCLADEDIVIPCGDGYLIIFASADSAGVTRGTEEIRLLLVEFYLGQEGLARLQVQAARTKLSSNALQALAGDDLAIEEASVAPNFMFAPVWQAQQQIVVAYFCTPVLATASRRLYAYDQAYFETGVGESDDFLATDIEALAQVEKHLCLQAGAELRPTLGVPVHATTMRRRASRVAYLERLNRLTSEHARRLSVRISEIPRGTPVTTIADWVGQLRGKTRTILLQFHQTEPAPAHIEDTGATGVGFFAPRNLSAAGASASQSHVRAWAEKLAQAKMVFFLDDLPTAESAAHAIKLGANFLTSMTMWPCAERPGEVRHVALSAQRGF